MYFSIIFFGIILIFLVISCLLVYKKYSWKIYIGYLEKGEASADSYREGKYSKNRYFYYKDGVLDLKKHPEYQRFHTLGGKDVLVKTWNREENVYFEEGKTKIAIFEVIEDEDKDDVFAIPCLRTVERLIIEDSDNPLDDYKKTSLLVSWGKKEYESDILPSENLIGIVEYESL